MNKTINRLVLPVFLLAFAAGLFACTGGPSLTVNTDDDQSDGTCDATHCSLREALYKANTLSGTVWFGGTPDPDGQRMCPLIPSLTQFSVLDPVPVDKINF